jgi:hypothetical protein
MSINYYFYPYIALTGGADGALDSLDGSLLKDGDAAYVVIPSTKVTYVYTLDDNNAGTKRWIRTNSPTDTNDVKYYGAVGNGVTDDRTAMAGADAGATGFVRYTPGTYVVASDITLTTPIIVEPGATFLMGSGKKITFASGCVSSVDPDWFSGTDNVKVQGAINSALAGTLSIPLMITRRYTLTAAVNIDRPVDTMTDDFIIYGVGLKAGFYTSSAIDLFSSSISHTTGPVSEYIKFDGIRFEASANATSLASWVIDGDKFLRIKFINCWFEKMRLATTGNYFQSYTLINCNIERFAGVFLEATGRIYDLHVTDNVFDRGDAGGSGFVKSGDLVSGSDFKGNLYENYTGPFYDSPGSRGVIISGNYFEAVVPPIIKLGENTSIAIVGNFFVSDSANRAFWLIELGQGALGSYRVYSAGNWTNGYLYDNRGLVPNAGQLVSVGDFSDVITGYSSLFWNDTHVNDPPIQMVSNGNFSVTTNWTPDATCTIASAAGGVDGNCLQVTRVSGATQQVSQALSGLVLGQTYELIFYVKSGSAGATAFIIGLYSGGWKLQVPGTSTAAWVRYSGPWVCDTATPGVYIVPSMGAGTFLVDEISVKINN